MFVCCLKSENSFGLFIGNVTCALSDAETCIVASASSRSIFAALSESRENGCVDCEGKASCALKSCTSDRMVRALALLGPG